MLLPPRDAVDAGAVLFWPPVLATWGPGTTSDPHRHHATQLIVALDGELVLRGEQGRAPVTCEGVLAPSGAQHAVDAAGTDVLIVFVEPHGPLGRALAERALSDLAARGESPAPENTAPDDADGVIGTRDLHHGLLARPLPDDLLAQARALLPPHARSPEHVAAIREALPSLLRALGATLLPPASVHPGVRRVLRHLASRPAPTDTTLEGLAALAGLSPGRFMHVFTQSVGSPLRHYLLWHKLGRAARAMAAGASASAAAGEAGFADAAHYTRTFRRMFGITPSAAQRPTG
jgi:AraC-like DNA-binding protein